MAAAPVLLLLCLSGVVSVWGQYTPDWNSIDSRPLPAWYDDVKFGIFMHWGVFSVPSFKSEWFWKYWKQGDASVVEFMKKNYPPNFTYADFATKFTTEFFDPNEWADLLAASGAKYVVLTSKHHEGYTNWPSPVSWNWNSMDVGPHRDLVGELATAIRNRTDIHYGLYHSLFEWFHPLYLQDKANGFKTQEFVKNKAMPELIEIVNKYHPEVIWSDGDWEAPWAYWNSTEFLAWLYNDSPVKDVVVTNDRWGQGTTCKHGGYLTCSDKYNPGHLLSRKWENAMTIDCCSWGFRREAKLKDYLTLHDILSTMAETVSCGGNLLVNIGPTHDGRIAPIFEDRLRGIGDWLKVNGDAIHGTQPWAFQNDTTTKDIWYTKKGSAVYAIVLNWPVGFLKLGSPVTSGSTTVELVGYGGGPLKWNALTPSGINIQVPNIPVTQMPCKEVYVFKMSSLTNANARPTRPIGEHLVPQDHRPSPFRN